MLRRVVNFLRGSVRVEVSGVFPERFLNLCAQHGLPFWQVEWRQAHCLRLTLTRRGAARAPVLAEKARCMLQVVEQSGALHFLGRFRRRYALLAGLVLSLCAVGVLSRFVLTVEVSGNRQVSDVEILTALRRQGLYPGVYGPALDEPAIINGAMLQLPELSWMSVNRYGIRAEVLVREAQPPPELEDDSCPGHVTAEAGGVILRMDTLEGEALCRVGDTVIPGQVLISGDYPLPQPLYSEGGPPGCRQVRAAGRVWARTWRTLTACMPLTAELKRYTGAENSRWSIIFLGTALNFGRNSGISTGNYDKISNTWAVSLPGGRSLPLAIRRETVRAYTTEPADVNRAEAERLLKARLDAALAEQLGPDGRRISGSYSASVRPGRLEVTLLAECREEIGKFVPLEQSNVP